MDLGIYVAPQQGATYDDQLAAAMVAERCGFAAFVRSDHYLPNGDAPGFPGPTDTWVTPAGLARETSTIAIGTLVSAATFRSPGQMSVIAAQVDAMSDGRLIFGIGAGWYEREHEAFGIDFPPLGERFDRLDEQLEILNGLWATEVGARFTHDGPHYRLTDSPGLPKPSRSPRPWTVVGGTGQRRTPNLAARFADEFNLPPFQTPDQAAELFNVVRTAERSAERSTPLVLSVTLTTFCGATKRELEQRGAIAPNEFTRADLCGEPDELGAQLASYAKAGASRAYLRIVDLRDLDHIELLANALLQP